MPAVKFKENKEEKKIELKKIIKREFLLKKTLLNNVSV